MKRMRPRRTTAGTQAGGECSCRRRLVYSGTCSRSVRQGAALGGSVMYNIDAFDPAHLQLTEHAEAEAARRRWYISAAEKCSASSNTFKARVTVA